MNRRDRRRQAAQARRARKAQKRREFQGMLALSRGGYMVLHPSRVRELMIEQHGEIDAVDETAREAVS